MVDEDFCLVLTDTRPAEPDKGWLPVYSFDIIRLSDGAKMGEFGLKIGEPPRHVGHIRYRVFPEFRGHHYAARACRLIIPLARRHGINPLRITCREDNAASRRTAELAGATLNSIVETPEGYSDWTGPVATKCDYHLSTDDVSISDAAASADMARRLIVTCHCEWEPLLGEVLDVRARAYEPWNGPKTADDQLRERQSWAAKWRPRSHVRLLSARWSSRLVGYLLADEREPGQFYIGHIGVLPEHQQKGVGNALMARCETEAVNLGCTSVCTSTYTRYPAMLALLSRRGYSRVQPAETGAGEDARLVFEKRQSGNQRR